eukprot:6110555-Prymnesium_polylepis.1
MHGARLTSSTRLVRSRHSTAECARGEWSREKVTDSSAQRLCNSLDQDAGAESRRDRRGSALGTWRSEVSSQFFSDHKSVRVCSRRTSRPRAVRPDRAS